MALIKCSECGKEISDKAAACVHCGNPISKFETDKAGFESSECPELPDNLDIGKKERNWVGEAILRGYLDVNDNSLAKDIKSGDVSVWLHKSGVRVLSGSFKALFDIHNHQIVSMSIADSQNMETVSKNVFGRAIAGQLIFGPVGGVVGGMSGIGDKQKLIISHYLVVNYWSVDKQPKTLIIKAKQNEIKRFVDNRIKRLSK